VATQIVVNSVDVGQALIGVLLAATGFYAAFAFMIKDLRRMHWYLFFCLFPVLILVVLGLAELQDQPRIANYMLSASSSVLVLGITLFFFLLSKALSNRRKKEDRYAKTNFRYCPFCHEQIRKTAKLCRYCHQWINKKERGHHQ
jgi:hypothetical protein